jgi:glutathione S-transferase
MSALRLYELDNAEGFCTSPFVWRVRYVLQRKGAPYEPVPVGFLEIPRIGPGSLKTVPVLETAGEFRNESWTISEWLDAAYPDDPLFSSPAELAMVRFFDKWFGTGVQTSMFRACVYEIFRRVKPVDREYFRESRERSLGQTLESVAAQVEQNFARMREALLPMRLALRRSDFLGGAAPNYADYIGWSAFAAFGPLTAEPLLAADDSLLPWLERGMNLSRAMP